jgi:hypothetical protein
MTAMILGTTLGGLVGLLLVRLVVDTRRSKSART